MAQLPIIEFPDPRLRTRGRARRPGAAGRCRRIQQLIDDMFETMYEAPGIGLAATQVDVHQRFMVIDVSEDKTQPMVFVNPQIIGAQRQQVYQEGCLSVPGIFADVTRAERDHGAARSTAMAQPSNSRRRPARGMHPARDGPSGRQGLRRLPVAAQARAGAQEAGQAAQATAKNVRRRGLMALRIVFAGTPEFAVPSPARGRTTQRSGRRLHPARSARRTRPALSAVAGQARSARSAASRCSSPNR